MKKLFLFLLILFSCCARFDAQTHRLPAPQSTVTPVEPILMRPFTNDARCRQWVDSVLNKMSLKERIGQLFIYTIAPQQDKANRDLLRKVVDDYKVGGLLFSGGLMENQVALTNEAQKMADIPLMITFDGEWGLSMRLRGTPVFPRNMVLGCIQNDSLLYGYGCEMARQCRELGVQVNFAPVADVNINPKNPVINTRSFGESPVNVADKVIAYARGLEDGGVLSVSKHFPGHGDTDVDSHHSLPKLSFSRARLDSVELYPFRKVIQAGLSGMMVGHLEVPVLEPKRGVPSSLSRKVVHDLLTQEMQFKGLVFTDALAMKGVSANNTSICLQALQAGHDLLLVPRRIKEEVEAILDAVKSGAIRRFVVMAGCDGRMKGRDYYTEFAKALPKDTVILTAGCAKYRYNKLPLGDINGIPRVLDAGQCNDSYSLAVIAMKLKEVFELNDINELPIVYNIAWYEQKAVIVLLALLSLGVKKIHLGPTLPAFLSPNVAKVLVDTFQIGTISDVEDDLKMFQLS